MSESEHSSDNTSSVNSTAVETRSTKRRKISQNSSNSIPSQNGHISASNSLTNDGSSVVAAAPSALQSTDDSNTTIPTTTSVATNANIEERCNDDTREWSQSPPPPPELELYHMRIAAATDMANLSDVSGGADSDLEFNDYVPPTRKQSPSPPWGRSPSPPAAHFMNKKRRQSRWKKGEELAATSKHILIKQQQMEIERQLLEAAQKAAQGVRQVMPLIVDSEGRALDTEGNLLTRDGSHSIAAKIAATKSAREEEEEKQEMQQFEGFDPRLNIKPASRSKRKSAFQFVKPGALTSKANYLRAKALSEDLASRKKRPKVDVKEVAKSAEHGLEWLDAVPDVEWWDAKLLSDPTHYSGHFKLEMITDLVENPVIFRPKLLQVEAEVGHKSFLTKRERQKIRRMKRKRKHEQMMDELKLGIREAPEPRLKLSNIMRVLGTAAIADPTAAEAKATAQTEKRKMKHLLQNAERQLTPMERREKKRRKLAEDTRKEVRIAVFRVTDLSSAKHRYKIRTNAEQLNLTGCMLMLDDENINLVVVEGGPKGIRFYTNLMTNRIKWSETLLGGAAGDGDVDMTDVSSSKAAARCNLVWSGVVAKRAFEAFLSKSCDNESELKDFLQLRKVVHYFEKAKHFSESF